MNQIDNPLKTKLTKPIGLTVKNEVDKPDALTTKQIAIHSKLQTQQPLEKVYESSNDANRFENYYNKDISNFFYPERKENTAEVTSSYGNSQGGLLSHLEVSPNYESYDQFAKRIDGAKYKENREQQEIIQKEILQNTETIKDLEKRISKRISTLDKKLPGDNYPNPYQASNEYTNTHFPSSREEAYGDSFKMKETPGPIQDSKDKSQLLKDYEMKMKDITSTKYKLGQEEDVDVYSKSYKVTNPTFKSGNPSPTMSGLNSESHTQATPFPEDRYKQTQATTPSNDLYSRMTEIERLQYMKDAKNFNPYNKNMYIGQDSTGAYEFQNNILHKKSKDNTRSNTPTFEDIKGKNLLDTKPGQQIKKKISTLTQADGKVKVTTTTEMPEKKTTMRRPANDNTYNQLKSD